MAQDRVGCVQRVRKPLRQMCFTSGVLLLVVLCLLVPQSSLGSQIVEANDIQAFLNALDSNHKQDSVGEEGKEGNAVEVDSSWGIPDALATVGKLFKYELPKSSVSGEIASYKISELGQEGLPSWLDFDTLTNTLIGVPGQEHAGLQHYLEVAALGELAQQALARSKDMFTLQVHEDKVHVDTTPVPLKELNSGMGEGLKPIKCPMGSSVTMASIIVDTDLGMMKPTEKAGLLEGMCKHLQVPADLLKLMPVGNKPMFDSSALVAGPGDVKTPHGPGAVIQWEVGCGNVYANHMPILQSLESTSSDGSMSKAVGHGIVGWHVTNNKLSAPRRLKRQARIHPTPTPQATVGPPTRQPVPTKIVGETDGPQSRVVVTMSSPSFAGEIKPTKKHKHKHRTKTKGRHHHKTPKHSPKHHKTKTAMPTPTVVPIKPTKVVDMAPTMEPSMGRQYPSEDTSSPGVSRTEDLIQPSMTAPLPGVGTSTKTAILPTRPVEIPGVITTQPIKPTRTDETYTPPTKQPGVLEPTDKPERVTTKPIYEETPFNYAPILKNDIQRLKVRVGDTFDFRIPKDTFHDYEDGNTRKLKLVFLTVDGLGVPRNSWVKFDQEAQRLYGLPMAIHEDRQEYVIAAIDSSGKIARDPFEIVVERRPVEAAINHELSMTLDLDYDQFIADVDKRLDVANKVASIFGDKNSKQMTVTRIDKGSVEYAWTNNSLPVEPCPTREIAALVAKLLTENDTIQEEAMKKMEPYKIQKAGAMRKGTCAKEEDKGVWGTGEVGPKEVASKPSETSDDDVLITTVVPAVVIAAMLLLAALVACILYRKKRKGKLSDEDQNTFINKGIPIIFADELEDKPDPSSKPLIMDDEKPPLPPPEYPRSNSGSAPSTPGSGHKEPLINHHPDDDFERDLTSPPYQPPPPLTGTNGTRGPRPRGAAQPYRHPPHVQP